jgi:Spy/CpxP family protein refolding chaperone
MIRRMQLPFLLLLASGTALQAQEARPLPKKTQPGRVEAWALPSYKMMKSPFGYGSVENILRRKDDLKLTDQQVGQIEVLRKEEVARRQEEARELIDLQSRAAAGLLDRTEFRDAMEKQDDAQRIAARNVRNRLERILTDEQLEQIQWPLFGKMPLEFGNDFRFFPGDLSNFQSFHWMPSAEFWTAPAFQRLSSMRYGDVF